MDISVTLVIPVITRPHQRLLIDFWCDLLKLGERKEVFPPLAGDMTGGLSC